VAQISKSARRDSQKLATFALGGFPAPALAALTPAPLAVKAVVAATVAAAQAAYYLTGEATCTRRRKGWQSALSRGLV
jgi:cytochrome c1